MYSGFKNGIRGLSLLVGAPKCPTKYIDDDVEVGNYVASLFHHLTTKKGIPKKWWNIEVVQLLLELHLQHTKEFGAGKQGVAFIEAKKEEQKSKYEKDQKNRESELARKRLQEEKE
jgi:hypothetical protein